MKTKKTIDPQNSTFDRTTVLVSKKPKSLRPMRSMVAVRSLKSHTKVTAFARPAQEKTENL